MPRSKILTVGPIMGLGGAGRRYNLLARHLFTDQTSHFVLTDDGKSSEVNKVNLKWESERSYLRIIATLAEIIEACRPDAIIGFGLYPNLVVYYANKHSNIKTKVILNEISNPRKVIDAQLKRSYLKSQVVSALASRAYRHSDLVLANSTEGVEECIDFYRVPANRCRRVHNLVDVDQIRMKAREDWPERRIITGKLVCTLGNLVSMKRTEMVIESIYTISKKRDVSAVIVGSGPEEAALKKRCDALGMRKRVHFMGRLDNPFKVLARADLLVQCSEWEGYSNSVLEAMVLGVPVVSSRSTKDVSILESERKLLCFDIGDQNALNAAILQAMKADIRTGIVSAAKHEVERHRIDTAIMEYKDAILEAIG